MGTQRKSLWESAKAKLDEEDQDFLAFDGQDRLEVLDKLGETAHAAHEECVRKKWRIKIPGKRGEKIIVRDLLSKVVHWLKVFKEVGDQVVQYDPGHVALPWAGIRFLLQIAINDIDKFDFVVQGAERIARMTTRYRLIEGLYLSHSSPATEELEKTLERVYIDILKYLAKAKRYFQQRTGVRIIKSGLLPQNDFQELLHGIEKNEIEADRCIGLVQAEVDNDTADKIVNLSLEMRKGIPVLQEALGRMGQPISRIASQIDQVEDHLQKMQRIEILDWLSSQPYSDHHMAVMTRVLDGTGHWLLQHRSFKEWRYDSTNSILWIRGQQGTGKSSLASVVIEDSKSASEKTGNDSPTVYFYCSRSTAELDRSKAQKILSCIARQLSCTSAAQPLAPAALRLYKRFNEHGASTKRSITLEESRDLITGLTELYSSITIVLDALDECDIEMRGDLIEALEHISTQSTSLVKILVTSREEGDLRLSLQDHSSIQVTASENGDDIHTFVEIETEKLVGKKQLLAYIRSTTIKDELKAMIKADIISKANGMFRWAQLQLQSLRRIRFEKDIRSALARSAPDMMKLYEDLYEHMLSSAQETDREIISNALKWTLCAREVLNSENFIRAITTPTVVADGEIDEDMVVDLLTNFLVCVGSDQKTRHFEFAHLSVREYLENRPEYSIEENSTLAAEVCLITLIGSSGSPGASRFVDQLGFRVTEAAPFYKIEFDLKDIQGYSVTNWGSHCDEAGEASRTASESALQRLFNYFLFDDSHENCPLSCWMSVPQTRNMTLNSAILVDLQKWIEIYSSVHDRVLPLACIFGFHEVVNMSSFNGVHDEDRMWCIIITIKTHQIAVLKKLLDGKISQKTIRHGLQIGVENRDSDAVKTILPYLEPRRVTKQVVLEAVQSNGEIMNMLLRHNQDPDILPTMLYGSFDSGALEALRAHAPDVTVDKLYLNRTAFLEKLLSLNFQEIKKHFGGQSTSKITCEVIIKACESRNPDKILILEYLLERGGKLNPTEQDTMRAIVFLHNGNVTLSRILMNHGWPFTQKVIDYAAKKGPPSLVKFLLDGGGRITSQTLENAARSLRDRVGMLQLILTMLNRPLENQEWSNIIRTLHGPRSEFAWQVLRDAKPHLAVPREALLADLDDEFSPGFFLRIVLHENREIEVTEKLLELGLQRLESDKLMSQVLEHWGSVTVTISMMLSAVQNHECGDKMTQLLLSQNEHIAEPTEEIITVAVSNERKGFDILQTLENRFGEFIFSDAAIIASSSGSLKTVRLILERHPTREIPAQALLGAAANGHISVMKLLLDRSKATVTHEMVIAAIRNTRDPPVMFKFLWNEAPNMQFDYAMLVAAAAKFDFECIESFFLLLFQAGDIILGPDILNPLILSRGGCYFVRALLESDFAFNFTDEVIDNILKASQGFLILNIFSDHGYEVKASPERIDMAIEYENVKELEFLLELDGSHDMVSDKSLSQAAAKENMKLLDVLHSVFLPSMDIVLE